MSEKQGPQMIDRLGGVFGFGTSRAGSGRGSSRPAGGLPSAPARYCAAAGASWTRPRAVKPTRRGPA
jgi:hypothetical protein